VLIPFRTLVDPEVQGEGSIDPLGLALLADRLADWILPGMTARMWRPRFLTAMAAAASILQGLEDEVAHDGVTPPWLILEWYFVEAIADVDEPEAGTFRRIPGIDKARRARRDKVPMNPARYLKTPKVFGFHGVYKRLARHLDIVDDDLRLGDRGYTLVRIWAAEQGIPEFLHPERDDGTAKTRQVLREAVQDSLRSGQTERPRDWRGAEFFVTHLGPHRVGRREAEFLWEALQDARAGPRGEVFRLLRPPEVRRGFQDGNERALLQALRRGASPDLALRMNAIEAYESFCRPLQEAWDHLRRVATLARPAVVGADDAARDGRFTALARTVSQAIDRARPELGESPIAAEFDSLTRPFAMVRDGGDFFEALWNHHVDVQREKPPDGKRSWFEATKDGGLVVRPSYRVDEDVPPREWYVHPYRLHAVGSFIDDLWGLAGGQATP
jgi:hypothetical protein